MGFGTALALGFIQQTNKNMAEKRAAEAEAARAGKEAEIKRREGVSSLVSTLVQKEMMDPQKAAQITALNTQGLVGMTDVYSAVKVMDDTENSLVYGDFSIPRPEKWDEDIRPDNLLRAGGTWLRTHNQIFADEDKRDNFIAALEADPVAKSSFMNDLARYQDYYIEGFQKATTNSSTGEVYGYLPPKKAYRPLFEGLALVSPDVKIQDTSTDKIVQSAKDRGDIDNPNTTVVFNFTNTEGISVQTPYDFGKNYESVERIATNLNYGTVQEFVNDFGMVSRADNADNAYNVLLASVELEKMGALGFNKTAAVSNAEASAIGQKLRGLYADDRVLMVNAMATLMNLDEDKSTGNRRRKIKMSTGATYFKKYLDVSVTQIREQYAAGQTTVRQLNELKALVDKKETPTGLMASMTRMFGGIAGPGGQLEQLLGNNTQGINSKDVLQRAKDAGFISTTVIQDLSKIEALKLTLAAQMARAVDPSGRLSNQDFEVQLQRLGQTGLFTSKEQATTSLDVVIADFEERLGRLRLLNELSYVEEFGKREARLLKADAKVQIALDASYKSSLQQTSTGTSDEPTGKSLTLNKDLNLYSDGTTFYYDEQGTKPVSDDDLDDAIVKAYGNNI